MTCIVGLMTDDDVWIGGDSAGISDYNLSVRSDAKIFHRGEMLFGFTSSFRMGQILRFHLSIPTQDEGQDDYAYMCTSFIDAVKECLKTNGFARVNNNSEAGGTFLVAYRNKLYTIEDDYQVAMNAARYAACGCGYPYALGAMSAMIDGDNTLDPETLLRKALQISEQWSCGVRGPFTILSLQRKEE